jgi:hypothetical protein
MEYPHEQTYGLLSCVKFMMFVEKAETHLLETVTCIASAVNEPGRLILRPHEVSLVRPCMHLLLVVRQSMCRSGNEKMALLQVASPEITSSRQPLWPLCSC